jgi:hypothetical protein
MSSLRLAAIVLLIAGVLGVAYGGFSYTKDTHDVKLGPVELAVKEKERVNIPLWVGIAAVAVGGVLFGMGGKRS